MILTGKNIYPYQAKKMGLVDEAVTIANYTCGNSNLPKNNRWENGKDRKKS
ncbi:MAG: hypothetical protein R2777_07420 [Chitinophagales bacterium]